MKNYILASLFLLFLSSCEGDERKEAFKNYKAVEGNWKLATMAYKEKGILKSLPSSTTLSFLGDEDRNRAGIMTTAQGAFEFTYNLGSEVFSIDVTKADSIPLDAPGRSNTFKIKFFSDNRFEIHTPTEYLKKENKTINDVVYTFERK